MQADRSFLTIRPASRLVLRCFPRTRLGWSYLPDCLSARHRPAPRTGALEDLRKYLDQELEPVECPNSAIGAEQVFRDGSLGSGDEAAGGQNLRRGSLRTRHRRPRPPADPRSIWQLVIAIWQPVIPVSAFRDRHRSANAALPVRRRWRAAPQAASKSVMRSDRPMQRCLRRSSGRQRSGLC